MRPDCFAGFLSLPLPGHLIRGEVAVQVLHQVRIVAQQRLLHHPLVELLYEVNSESDGGDGQHKLRRRGIFRLGLQQERILIITANLIIFSVIKILSNLISSLGGLYTTPQYCRKSDI